jgi:hypothetical protein
MKAQKESHEHVFELTTQDVLLASYKPEEGKMKYQTTTGKDTLKQRVCECGLIETYDLERMRA